MWNDGVSAIGAGVSSSSADAYAEDMFQHPAPTQQFTPMIGATVAADEADVDLNEIYQSYSEDERF